VAISVGLITFTTTPAAGASTGGASVNESIVNGDVLRITVPHGVATKTETVAGTFLFTDTTFTFDPAGAPPAMTWIMRPGNFTAGAGSVARTLYMVRREDAQCLNAITATKQ
jgi:hypothetical protein